MQLRICIKISVELTPVPFTSCHCIHGWSEFATREFSHPSDSNDAPKLQPRRKFSPKNLDRIPPAKFFKPSVSDQPPQKKPRNTNSRNTRFGVCHDFCLCHSTWKQRAAKKRQGYGALEEGSLRGIMALDLYHFTGAQGNGQVAMRRTSVRWVGRWWWWWMHSVFSCYIIFLKLKDKNWFSKPKHKKGHIRRKELSKLMTLGFCFSSEKMGANFCTVVSDGSRGPFQFFSWKGQLENKKMQWFLGSFCFNWRRSVDEPRNIFLYLFVGFPNDIPGKKWEDIVFWVFWLTHHHLHGFPLLVTIKFLVAGFWPP